MARKISKPDKGKAPAGKPAQAPTQGEETTKDELPSDPAPPADEPDQQRQPAEPVPAGNAAQDEAKRRAEFELWKVQYEAWWGVSLNEPASARPMADAVARGPGPGRTGPEPPAPVKTRLAGQSGRTYGYRPNSPPIAPPARSMRLPPTSPTRIKHGIIAVPVGEEDVLFGPWPDHVISQGFLDAVSDANREYYDEDTLT
ncbi:hypothetical protein C8A05DRAFT_39725 [Staphylotrichum tortipilum]|uniref:Uncharacterized protein n=1 Tax=Staphylotrichum tortipilum TaxID=2831512 RepID=A0AAN6MA99_9PEZI|nr:hypothetical protein C8A05DRAFT_39725 [Staphylotrichum longicolle]